MRISWPCSIAALAISGFLLTGCADFWSGQTKPDPGNCVAIPDLCSTGQHCNQDTEACEFDSPQDPPSDLNSLPVPPGSFVLPGGLGGVFTMQTFPRDADYVLAAPDPSATIYYTTDGTVPSPGAAGTQSGPTPLKLAAVPGGTTIRWFGDYGPAFAPEQIHLFSALTNPVTPDSFGFLPQAVMLGPNNLPIVTAAPGEQITGSVNVQMWASTPTGYCPGCIVQYVISVQSQGAIGCLNNTQGFGTYPGATANLPLVITAPMTPGRYSIYSGLALQFSCDGTSPGGTDIGEIIVQ